MRKEIPFSKRLNTRSLTYNDLLEKKTPDQMKRIVSGQENEDKNPGEDEDPNEDEDLNEDKDEPFQFAHG